jgi:asparagine synthase (glutamine-hydrolysing)
MCGIAGVLNLDGRPADPDLLSRMAVVMAHRGPDGEGFHRDGPLGLAFRRLSIIDLSHAGDQPMSTPDGSLWLVFNGELYNFVELGAELRALGHHFQSHADSEVVLHAFEEWGQACLDRLLGMFAFAIWDARRRRLTLVRDRLGIKPLYVAEHDGSVVFGSEIKALRELPGVARRARPEAIAQYLAFTHAIDDQTWFEGVNRVPPGGLVTVAEAEGMRSRSWWDPVDLYRSPSAGAGRGAPQRIRDLLEEAVRIHLRSDVPVGAHLSGGLDSSTVVALVAGLGDGRVATFSGAFAEGAPYDERRWIRLVVERYGTDHREVVPTADELPRDLPRIAWHMDEPTAGPGVFPQYRVCRLARDAGVIVVNGGQGGDEVFGGYPRYLRELRGVERGGRAALPRPDVLRTAARRELFGGRLAHLLSGLHPDLGGRLRGYRPERPTCALGDRVAEEMYFDLRHYLPALLHVEDRTSMAVSLESRVPLLDHRLVELMAAIPSGEKLAGGALKPLLRAAVRDVVPAEIIDRTDKRGFPTPVGPWLRGPLLDWARRTLLDGRFAQHRVFAPARLRATLEGHRLGLPGTTHLLWSAISIALWFEAFEADSAW